jgi:formylglycine-generating enzyme
MKTTLVLVLLICVFDYPPEAQADTFGSGANQFAIEFVPIGNPGNSADTTGSPNPVGSVPYDYRMGKFEISEQVINKANSLGGLFLTPSGRGPNKPATDLSWNEMARFVNWLNTSTGSHPAYKFTQQPGDAGYDSNANIELWTALDVGFDSNNVYRNRFARYFLPSEDEWYKAAFYDPNGGGYFSYPTSNGSVPTPVSAGMSVGTAVFDQSVQQGPADITLAGGPSPSGTVGQGGNAWERIESDFDRTNDSSNSFRVERGGGWFYFAEHLSSSYRLFDFPTVSASVEGFRVASLIPEPSTLVLLTMAGSLLVMRRRH